MELVRGYKKVKYGEMCNRVERVVKRIDKNYFEFKELMKEIEKIYGVSIDWVKMKRMLENRKKIKIEEIKVDYKDEKNRDVRKVVVVCRK